MDLNTNLLIFLSVLGIRFFLPLLIFRYPLPAIIGCLIIDAVDQTIFQKTTTIPLDNYQSYDKALDIYYLSIAYDSTLRNWNNLFAVKVSRFLFYYRIIGVVLFELLGIRGILLIFPNTFEYFFIFYEAVRLRWDPKKFSKKFWIIAAAFIWIFIKLPQEYIIHVAQVDTTDWIKMTIFNVPPETTFPQIFEIYPLLIPSLLILGVVLFFLIRELVRKLPKADHKISLGVMPEIKPKAVTLNKSFFKNLYPEVFEKAVFVGLLLIIFSQLFPSFQGTATSIFIGAAIVVVLSAWVAYLFGPQKISKLSLQTTLAIMFFINTTLATLYLVIVSRANAWDSINLLLFFALILTMFTVFYDTYRPYYAARLKS